MVRYPTTSFTWVWVFLELFLKLKRVIGFRVQTADIDEKSIRRENPDELVMVLAEAKVEHFFIGNVILLFLVCTLYALQLQY